VEQTSLLDPSIAEPVIADLAGVLCGQGQIVNFGHSSARLSVVVADLWRAQALAAECALRGLAVEIAQSDGGQPLIRTPFAASLLQLSALWQRGAVKAVPAGFHLTDSMLRMWALIGGYRTEVGYLLALDRRAPDTHTALSEAMRARGLGGVRVGPRGGGPGIRISGKRRLAVLAELLGQSPEGAELAWPNTQLLQQAM